MVNRRLMRGVTLRRRMTWVPVKRRAVGAQGNLNPNWQIGLSGVVILLQPAPDFARLNPDHRIVPGGIVGVAVKDLGADNSLFQLLMVSRIFSSSPRITAFAAPDSGAEWGCGARATGSLPGIPIKPPGLRWEL